MKADKEAHSPPDLFSGLSDLKIKALQERGDIEIVTSDGKKLLIRIIQAKCMGAESCVTVAPVIFALDTRQLGLFRKGNEPLQMKKVVEGSASLETIILAAKSCPYKAIFVRDAEREEDLAGDPW